MARAAAVAERLLFNRRQVIDLWESRVVAEVSSARGLDSPILRNSLEEFLKQLAAALTPAPHVEPRLDGGRLSELAVAAPKG